MSPTWFYGYDVTFEVVFAIISLIIALFAFKIYKASDQRYAKFLGISFSLISFSYFIQSAFNFFAISKLNENICGMIRLNSVALFDSIGVYLHMLFFLLGIVILVFMVLKSSTKIN